MRSVNLAFVFALLFPVLAIHAAENAAPDPSGTKIAVLGSDTEHARQIRRSLVEDKTLSTAAQNVNIDVKEGMAHLRGVVKTELERKEVEARAHSVMGDGKVISELKIDAQ